MAVGCGRGEDAYERRGRQAASSIATLKTVYYMHLWTLHRLTSACPPSICTPPPRPPLVQGVMAPSNVHMMSLAASLA